MLKIRPEKHRLIAVVGAGGKTTLIYELSRELKKAGYRAAVTTTTHMYREGRYGFVPVGNGVSGEKLTGVSPEVPRGMLETYDVVLVEADGSHGLPLKCPASFEPVIPVETDLVIGVAGASAVRKRLSGKMPPLLDGLPKPGTSAGRSYYRTRCNKVSDGEIWAEKECGL